MIKLALLPTLLLFTACSFQTPQNNWHYKSSAIFDSYTKNYLSGNDTLAKSDLKRALHQASLGADVQAVAKIYLGECALKISLTREYSCDKYKKIQTITKSSELNAYYNFITQNFEESDIELLPKQYRSFAEALKQQEYKKANEYVREIEPTTSQLIAAALLGDNLSEESINATIKAASFHGYKRAALSNLELLKSRTNDPKRSEEISAKIKLLQSIK